MISYPCTRCQLQIASSCRQECWPMRQRCTDILPLASTRVSHLLRRPAARRLCPAAPSAPAAGRRRGRSAGHHPQSHRSAGRSQHRPWHRRRHQAAGRRCHGSRCHSQRPRRAGPRRSRPAGSRCLSAFETAGPELAGALPNAVRGLPVAHLSGARQSDTRAHGSTHELHTDLAAHAASASAAKRTTSGGACEATLYISPRPADTLDDAIAACT